MFPPRNPEPRLNGRGALAALWSGFVIGIARLILELAKGSLPSGTLWSWIAGINFLHFAALLFVVCSAILIVVSFPTPPPARERVEDLTLQTATTVVDADDTPAERRLTIGLSLLLAATIGALWYVFRWARLRTQD